MEYTRPLAELTEFFQRFPGIGPKSAQRLAFYLLKCLSLMWKNLQKKWLKQKNNKVLFKML